ncbi:MAG: PD-(D/E)XK nuclease family transposase, partial [Bacilli bacterium]|nr:PD-(D/E)XK nuclease family transposase [Bacilli bacterium]
MKKFYKIRNDIVFKSIFCKEENKELLERLIKEVIGEDVTVISLNVPELIKDKVYVKGKTLDVLV